MIRPPKRSETQLLIELATSTGIFSPAESRELFQPILSSYHWGSLGKGHKIQVHTLDDASKEITGWVYYAPTQHAPGAYDLWWIGVAPKFQNQGYGKVLLEHVESAIRSEDPNARVLVIETGGNRQFEGVREWYARRGYVLCGHVPEFYGKGESKAIFSKVF